MEHSRDMQLSACVFQDRMRDLGRETQQTLSGVLVSVAVANAAYVLSLLLASAIPFTLWLPFLAASFAFVIVTLTGSTISNLFVVSMSDWLDTALPLLQALMMFLMFSMLIPVRSELPLLAYWYLVPGAHSLIGALWMRKFISRIRHSSYEGALHGIVERHLDNLHRTSIIAAASGLIWICIWALIRFWISPYHAELLRWQGLLGLIALAIAIGIVLRNENYRRAFLQSVQRGELRDR
jgi:hypothetical protein